MDGSGNLYAGGNFSTAFGGTLNYIAKWNGSVWSALGSGMDNTVQALALDNGGHLFVGGAFFLAGTTVSPFVAQGNVAAQTPAPSLTAPATNSVSANPVNVSFSLPAAATNGTVTLTFTGAVTRTLTLANSQGSAGTHGFSFDPANPTAVSAVASLSGGTSIPDGVYTVTLSYQDSLGDPAASASSSNVQIDTVAPSGGTVTMTPVSPVAASAALTVNFANWTDASTLSYAILIDNAIVSAQGAGPSRNITGPSAAGAHTLTGRIYDAAGNFTDVTQSFQVLSAQLSNWEQTYFGGSGPGTGLTESFTNDGIANLTKFAMGLNPTVPGGPALQWNGTFSGGGNITSDGLPIVAQETTGGTTVVRALFIRRSDYASAGLIYTPQFSPAGLTGWQTSTDTPTILSDNGMYQLLSLPFPASINGMSAGFFRIQISLAQ
jgi:hypothetical protein